MDMDTVCCSNPECYEEIEKKKNGEFPKCCPECGAKVVHAQLDPVVICSSCHEEIARKKNGELPKCCTECGVAVALPGRQLSIQELRCSCAACGEKLPKNSKGEYTKYCPNCSQPVGIPDAVFPRSMLSCSSCGHQVGRNKKGVFPKYCPECDFELKVESSQVGGQRLNVQPTSFHNPKESGSLSPTSVGRSSSPSTHMPATPSTDAAATPSTDAPTTPRKDVPVTPSADVPATPSTDVPATPSPIADVPQPKSSLLASDQVPAGFNESHYHKAATEQCMSSGQTGLNRSIDSLHDTKNQLKQGDGGTVSIGPPFVSMDSSGVVTEEPKNGQTKSVNLQSYVIVDRQGSEQVNEESVKDCEEKMQDTNTPNTGIEELHSSETSVYTQPRCQEKTQLGSSMPPGLPQIAGATLQSQSNASGGSRINPANIQYYGRDLPNQDQPTGGNNAPGLSTAITSDNPVFSDQLKLTDTVSCPPDQPREEEQRDESDDEHYHMAGDSSLDPPERKENTSVSTSDNAVLSDHLKLTGTATCPPHRFERGVPPTTTRSLPLDMDEHARGIEKNAKQLLGASDPSAKTQSLPLKVLGQYVGSESAFVEQFKPRGKVTRSQSLQHESATDTETVKSERESSSVLVPSSGASPHFSPTSSAHAFSAQAIPVGGEVVAGDTAGREQRDGYDNAEKEDHMASDNSFVPPKQKENISVSGPMSSSVRGSDLGTDVDAIVGRPEQHAGEVDVVEVFLDLKVCLNDVHRMVLMKDMCVRHMKTQEEDFVEKEKKEAQRLYARYESTVRNAGGGTQAAAEAQNSLRKFINGKSEQLNQILLRHNLGKLNVLHVQKPGRGSPVQTRSRQRQLIEKTKEVTFKAVLSSAIVKKFQKVDKTPTVEIVSDFYDNFLSVLVRLERTKEDIWVGKWNAPDSNRTLRYKYFVHDGVEIHGDCFEWLGQDTYNVIINRCLFLPGLTHGQVIYDGIVMWRDSVLTSLKRAVTSDKFKDDERARGMLTMLPNWTEEMEKGTPIQDLFNWVNAVLWRQGELFGRFSAFTRNYYYQSAAAHIPQVNEVFQEYITIGLTLHKSLLGNFAEKATILASLLGLIHLAMSSDARSVSVRQLLQMSPQFVDDTMDAVSHGYDKDASSELFSHIALGDESFVR